MLGLVCIDVDGTLVGHSNQVHPKVWDMAAQAVQAGLKLAICTGRPALSTTLEYARQLDPSGWHIFQGGASLLQPESGQSRSHPLSEAALQHLLGVYARTGWVLELYSDHDYVVEVFPSGSEAERLARDHAHLIGVDFKPRGLDQLQGTPVRAQWVVSGAQKPAAMASCFDGVVYASATSPSVPDACFISVTAAGVDKCSAIRELAALSGVPLSRTMMIGDGQNDLHAMQLVGHPVAMQNADPVLRAVCRYQVGHVEEGGVAEALALALTLDD
jgi:Cof subfamily protein (haloacid dehalogenase superfamily)